MAIFEEPGAPNAAFSDDFAGLTLDSGWTFFGAAGSARLGVNQTDGFLEITSPTGAVVSASDLLTTPRVLQTVENGDFQVVASFLTEPSIRFQEQGILIVEDDTNFIRFDIAFTSNGLNIIIGNTVDGNTQFQPFQRINTGEAQDFRVTRDGDLWTFEYSADGINWITAGTLDRAMTVVAVGPFAGSAGASGEPAPGYVAQVDFFENTAAPIINEDGDLVAGNRPPDAVDDALATDADTDLVIDIATDLLGNDTDPNGDMLAIVSVTDPTNGTLTDNGNGTLTYTPSAGFVGADAFTYTVSDGTETSTATVSLTVSDPGAGGDGFISDDFSDGTLNPFWQFEAPNGGAFDLLSDGGDAYVALVAPAGVDTDPFGSLDAVRLLQPTADEDFQILASFRTTPDPLERFQGQGLLAVQDDQNWIRVDVFSSGDAGELSAFGGITVNGNTSAAFNVPLPSIDDALNLRLTRTGDTFQLESSPDGANFTVIGSFDAPLTVTEAGVFASSIGAPTSATPGYTAEVDFIFNTASPIANEDGGAPTNFAPEATDDGAVTELDQPTTIDVLANDTDADNDALSIVDLSAPANGTVSENQDGTITYTPNAGFVGRDNFTYTITDGTTTDTATVQITVTPPGGFSEFISDDFATAALQGFWTFEAPNGGEVSIERDGTDAYVRLVAPPGVDTDPFNDFDAVRILQTISDDDFQLVANFRTLPDPEERFQGHGFLAVQDDENWIRLDIFSRGPLGNGDLFAFGGVTIDGVTITEFNVIRLPSVEHASNLRMTRSGDTWSLETSADGINWTVAGSFDASLTVNEAGVFAASISGPISESPGYIAEVDFVFNTASPILNEDGGEPPVLPELTLTGPDAPILEGDDGDTGSLVFTATLSEAAASAVTADVAISGNATGPATVTITPGETSATFTVSTTGDMLEEPNETITVTLANLQNATAGTSLTASGTVLDDDAPVTGTVTLLSESFSDPGSANIVSNAFVIAGGSATTSGNADGTLAFTPVNLSGVEGAVLRFDISTPSGNFEVLGSRFGDEVRIELVENGVVTVLDVFSGDGPVLRSLTSDRIIDRSVRTLEYALDSTAETAQIRIVSDISASNEVVEIDNLVIEAIGDIVDPPAGPTITIGRSEAEDLAFTGDYAVETVAAASGGELLALNLVAGATGSVTGAFDGPAGTYAFTVGFFNENDGVSTYNILVNGASVAQFSGIGGTGAFGALDTETIMIDLAPGDVIAIDAARDAGERARIDFVDIEAPPPPGTVTLLSEDFSDPGSANIVSNAFVIAGGSATTSGNADGTLAFTPVNLSGVEGAVLRFDVSTPNGDFEAIGSQFGDEVRIELLENGVVTVLDVFSGDGPVLRSLTSDRVIDRSVSTLEYALDSTAETAQIRIVSDISAASELVEIDNLEIEGVGEIIDPPAGPTIVIDTDFSAGADGFVYTDDTFGTSRPFYASGDTDNGALNVTLGGRNGADITNGMSGGWSFDFTLDQAGQATLTFDFSFAMADAYEAFEFSQVLVAVDGQTIGINGNDFIAQLAGGGSIGETTVTLDLGVLSAGDHTLTLGGFNNQKTTASEITTISFDNVELIVDDLLV